MNKKNILLIVVLLTLVIRCIFIYVDRLNEVSVNPGIQDPYSIVSSDHENSIRESLIKCRNVGIPAAVLFLKDSFKNNNFIQHLYARFNRRIESPHNGILIVFSVVDSQIHVIKGLNLSVFIDDTVIEDFKNEVSEAGNDIEKIVGAFSVFFENIADLKHKYILFQHRIIKNISHKGTEKYSFLTIFSLLFLILLLSIINILRNRCPKCGAIIKMSKRDVPSQQKGEYIEIEIKECSKCNFVSEKKIIIK